MCCIVNVGGAVYTGESESLATLDFEALFFNPSAAALLSFIRTFSSSLDKNRNRELIIIKIVSSLSKVQTHSEFSKKVSEVN